MIARIVGSKGNSDSSLTTISGAIAMAASATLSNNVKTLLRAFCNALAPVLVSPTSFGVKPDVSPYPYNEWSSPPLVSFQPGSFQINLVSVFFR